MNTQDNAPEVAERIRLARRLAGMTQEDAARALDVTVRTYSRWENAETFGFLGELPRIAKLYGTAPDQLVPPEGGAGEVAALRDEVAELRARVEALEAAVPPSKRQVARRRRKS